MFDSWQAGAVAGDDVQAGRPDAGRAVGVVRGRSRADRGCPALLGERPAQGRWPGLLAEWAQRGGGWFGRVVYAVDDGGRVVLVEAWVPAEHLEPAVR
jgi:hypothetical protein